MEIVQIAGCKLLFVSLPYSEIIQHIQNGIYEYNIYIYIIKSLLCCCGLSSEEDRYGERARITNSMQNKFIIFLKYAR